MIRTVLGDLDPNESGAVYVHEHLVLDNPLIARDFPHILLDSVDAAVSELAACKAAGVGTMVDAMPCAGGRNVERLTEISRRSGIAIVATTGLHTSKYYVHHPWAELAGPDDLAALFIADITDGIDRYDYTGPVIDRTQHRAGIIKVATDSDQTTNRDRRLFAAAAAASRATGAPVITHCEDGRGAMSQIDLLDRLGVPLERVVLSHTDKVVDPAYHRDLLDTGVNLEYDQALRHAGDAEPPTARLLVDMIAAGFLGRLMLGTDGARRTLWTALGGSPGLAWLRNGFCERLRSEGIADADLTALFEANPRRLLSLEVPSP